VIALTLTFNVSPVRAEDIIYIRPDGTVDPSTAPIQRNGNVYTLTSDIYGYSICVEKDNVIIDGMGHTINGGGREVGVDVSGRSNVTIKNLKIERFWFGIRLYKSSNNKIIKNNLTANMADGISLDESLNNLIYGNNIMNNEYGIYLHESQNNTICQNNVVDNYYGIIFRKSPTNNLRGNSLDNKYNLRVDGSDVWDYIQDIDISNFVNGKPVYYWVNKQNVTVPFDAGYVALVNCTGIVVDGLSVTNNGQGILLAFTMDSVVTRSEIMDNEYGIYLYESQNNVVYGNNLTANKDYGIVLGFSSSNLICGNYVSDNKHGIWLFSSSNNVVRENNVVGNYYGILIEWGSLNNRIYQNNLIGNRYQAFGRNLKNMWDDGYQYGNYWSDYSGKDYDCDGVGDAPYVIDENNQDNYPLMGVFYDFKVTEKYSVFAICNFSISNFEFDGYTIRFSISCQNDTAGFCRICIPTALMNDTFKVFINNVEVPYTLLPCSNSTYNHLYFTYEHITEGTVLIIPEFSSALTLLITYILFSILVIIYVGWRKPAS